VQPPAVSETFFSLRVVESVRTLVSTAHRLQGSFFGFLYLCFLGQADVSFLEKIGTFVSICTPFFCVSEHSRLAGRYSAPVRPEVHRNTFPKPYRAFLRCSIVVLFRSTLDSRAGTQRQFDPKETSGLS
jgi:hypothetical protein